MLFPAMPPWLAVVIGSITVMLLSMLVCMALAVVIERVAYKPLRDAPRIAALITAIGVSFFLEFFGALNFVFSPRFIPYQRPFDVVAWAIGTSGIHQPAAGQCRRRPTALIFSNIFLIIVVASIVVQVFLQFLVRRTKIGKAMRATSFDKPTARLMGINVDGVISFTFAIGAAFAGLGGVLYAIAYPSIWTQLGILPGLKAFVAAVLGRHRQHPRRLCRRADHGPGRGVDHGLHLHADARRGRLLDPDPRAPGAPDGHLRRACRREGIGGQPWIIASLSAIRLSKSSRSWPGSMACCGCWAASRCGPRSWASWPPGGSFSLALTDFGGFQVMNDFDRGLLFQACAMTMVALGLNLIYGFNGQFSLGQWGFYGLGAYVCGRHHLSLDQSGMPAASSWPVWA